MATRVLERPTIDAVVVVLILATVILMSGCIQDKSAQGAQDNQTQQTPERTETPVPKNSIEKVSGELDTLNSKGWSRLAADLKRPRTTTLLWYHLKETIGFEPKVVFGNPDKLKTALAIPVKQGGNSTFPKTRIKGADYYIIDPMTPAIIADFNYGYMYDDPGSVMAGYFNDFRLNTEDIAIVEQWIRETGADIRYTDFPVK